MTGCTYFVWILDVEIEKKSIILNIFKYVKTADTHFNCGFFSKSYYCSTLNCKNTEQKYEICSIFPCAILEQIAEICHLLNKNCFHKTNWLYFLKNLLQTKEMHLSRDANTNSGSSVPEKIIIWAPKYSVLGERDSWIIAKKKGSLQVWNRPLA